jgi:hypothetical protein
LGCGALVLLPLLVVPLLVVLSGLVVAGVVLLSVAPVELGVDEFVLAGASEGSLLAVSRQPAKASTAPRVAVVRRNRTLDVFMDDFSVVDDVVRLRSRQPGEPTAAGRRRLSWTHPARGT